LRAHAGGALFLVEDVIELVGDRPYRGITMRLKNSANALKVQQKK
jgi:hypothetical protein